MGALGNHLPEEKERQVDIAGHLHPCSFVKSQPLRCGTKAAGLTPSLQASVGQPQDQRAEMWLELPLVLPAARQEPGSAVSGWTTPAGKHSRKFTETTLSTDQERDCSRTLHLQTFTN